MPHHTPNPDHHPHNPQAVEFLSSFRFCPGRFWDDDTAVADTAVERIMLLGDIHNSRQILDAALRTAADNDCDALIQIGDFGLQDANWCSFSPEHAGLMHAAVHAPMPVVVVDGNHEAWPSLAAFLDRDDTQTARAAGRPLHLGGSLWWADRGSVWSWAGRRFGALGGTVSPNKWQPGAELWSWPQEMITQQDVDRLKHNASDGLDVLISHDAPADTTGLISTMWMPPSVQDEADTAQRLVQDAVNATNPVLMFHGHWHQPNQCRLPNGTEVIGLAADGTPKSAAILTVNDLQADYIDPMQRSHGRPTVRPGADHHR